MKTLLSLILGLSFGLAACAQTPPAELKVKRDAAMAASSALEIDAYAQIAALKTEVARLTVLAASAAALQAEVATLKQDLATRTQERDTAISGRVAAVTKALNDYKAKLVAVPVQ